MGLTGCQQEIHQASVCIADTDDLGAKTTPRPAQRFTFVGDIASESQTQSRPLLKALLGRTPDAF